MGPTGPKSARWFAVALAVGWLALAQTSRASWSLQAAPILAVALGLVAWQPRLATPFARAVSRPTNGVFLVGCALVAAGISWWVVRDPVGTKPVSIDAGVYLMEARAMAHGSWGMPVSGPGLAHSSKFLFEGPDGHLYGVFPPGYPLFLIPFVWLGAPMLAGPVVAALLVVAQQFLGVAMSGVDPSEDERLALRVSLLLSLPSWSRAMETADLLSHAFVALLAAVAIGSALRMRRDDRPRWAVAVGVAVGWAICARILDGLVLGVACLSIAIARPPRASFRALATMALGAAPFMAILLLHQHASTGSWTTPTQAEYFLRSDFPATCHRLGFGRDVGCTVEHPDSVADMGGDGYGVDDALRITRERASSLGYDLLGAGPLLLLAFAGLFLGATGGDWICAAFGVALTVAYSLFYYGNSDMFGARHLFPAAPGFYVLVARAIAHLPHRAEGSRFDRAHVRAGVMLAVFATAIVAERQQWTHLRAQVAKFQRYRSDLRRSAALANMTSGILKSPDPTAIAAAMDPWVDRNARKYVLDDRSGLLELRRRNPDLPVLLSLANDEVGRLYISEPPPPGVTLELERAWPSYQRQHGLGASILAPPKEWKLQDVSGGTVLALHHAQVGSSLDVPFEIGRAGTYRFRLQGIAGADEGNYDVLLDGAPLVKWEGYASRYEKRVTAESEPRTLDAARHVLTLRCAGKDPASEDRNALVDVLLGRAEE